MLFCNIDGQGTYWLKIKLDLRNVHWSNYPLLLYLFLCTTCLQLIITYLSYWMKSWLSRRTEKDPCKPPCGRIRFYSFFNKALFWWTHFPTKGSDLQIPITSWASGLLRLACSFLTRVLTNLTSFLCCRSGISHQAFRGHSCATTVPQPSHNATYGKGRSLAVTN